MVQPSFIFPSENTNTTTTTTTTITNTSSVGGLTPDTFEELKAGSNYFIGVGLCLFAAASCAVSNVINVRIQKSNPRSEIF